MAATLTDIRTLAERHAREVCRNPESWTDYLDTAARFYRYPFYDVFLIHAQRPEATACAAMPEWNKRMYRWVNRGSKGIALLDDSGYRLRLRYVFDIKDTHPMQGAKQIRLWQMDYKKEAKLKDHICDAYGITAAYNETMPQTFRLLAKSLTAENIRQAMYDLDRNRKDTYLETLGEVPLLGYFSKLIEESIAYVLMKRCGYHPLEHMDIDSFEMIRMFDDINVLPYLGEAVHNITEPVLMDIGRTVTEIDREEYRKHRENAPVAGQMAFKIDGREVIYDMPRNEQTKEDEIYGKQQKYHVPEERGVQLSEPDPERGRDRRNGQNADRNRGMDAVSKGKETVGLLDAPTDWEATAGEVITQMLLLPLLPSPEEQQELITESVQNETERIPQNKHPKEKGKIPEKKSKAAAKTRRSTKTTKKTKDTPQNERISIKTKLKEKQAEADALNKERNHKREKAPSKETVL